MNARHDQPAGTKSSRRGGCGCGGGSGSSKGAGSGCACSCESRCCGVECLVRPNFFCGQLLTDTDLSALVDWTRNRFALNRYRDGWGVVCGLEVTCREPDGVDSCCPDDGGPRVFVSPGYAVDCCGNDLVVCEPLVVDLDAICAPLDDPCEKPRAVNLPKTIEAQVAVPGRGACAELLKDLVLVDLKLRYREDLARGQRAGFRGSCSDTGPCEYARVLEAPVVVPELASTLTDDPAAVWQKDFSEKLRRFMIELKAAMASYESLLRYLRAHPPYRFCYLMDLVCCLMERSDQTRAPVPVEIVRLIYIDWLLHELECVCPTCRSDSGVLLARVALRRVPGAKARCRVVYIDARPRRPLQRDSCRPLAPGAIDLAPYLWQPPEQLERLKVDGIDVNTIKLVDEVPEAEKAKRWAELRDADFQRFDQLAFEWKQGALDAFILTDPFGHDRVLGFSART